MLLNKIIIEKVINLYLHNILTRFHFNTNLHKNCFFIQNQTLFNAFVNDVWFTSFYPTKHKMMLHMDTTH